MKKFVQALSSLILIIVIALHKLYINGIIDFKLLGIGDMNPYGGWNTVRELATNSSYEFDGISISIALTIALAAASIIGGRFFCGWLCPIGAIQDLSSLLGRKAKLPKYNSLSSKGFNPLLLKYPVLLGLLIMSVLGYGAKIAELSPWRALLNLSDIASAWSEMKIGFILLAGVLIASAFLSRFFCRYLCPLGAAQALLSSFSLFSMQKDKSCNHCNKCMESCPIGIKLPSESDTISPECIRCMNCLESCTSSKINGIHLKMLRNAVSVKAYAAVILTLFIIIWLALPKLFGVSPGTDDIIRSGTLKDGTYQGEAMGFAGKIITEVRIAENKITDVNILEHRESKGWYEEVFMELPKRIIKKQSISVDVISGATKSSKGLIESVGNAMRKAK